MHIPHEVGADVVRYDERRAVHDVRRTKSLKWHQIGIKRRFCLLVAWHISPSQIFHTSFHVLFVARYHHASVDIKILVWKNWLPLVKPICRFFSWCSHLCMAQKHHRRDSTHRQGGSLLGITRQLHVKFVTKRPPSLVCVFRPICLHDLVFGGFLRLLHVFVSVFVCLF